MPHSKGPKDVGSNRAYVGSARTQLAPQLGFSLDETSQVPLHRQIGEQVRRAILEGRLRRGTRLPSTRMLANDLHCARGTVVLAFDHLIAEGYVVSRAGSGMSIPSNLPEDMLNTPFIERQLPEVLTGARALSGRAEILLGRSPPLAADLVPPAFPASQPDLESFPFPLWAKLLERDWRKPPKHASASHPFGHRGLRDAIATYLEVARSFSCDPNSIVVTTGIRQGLAFLANLLLDNGDSAWVEDPGYVGVKEALSQADVRAVPIPTDPGGFQIDVAQAEAPEARLAVVAPAHQFPLGTVLSLQRRLALLNWAELNDGWIAEDDYDGEYRYSGRPLAPLRALDRSGRVVYFSSFSKILFPALRLSFLVLPDRLIEPAERLLDKTSLRAPLIAQGSLARFISEGHFAAHLRRTRQVYARRRDALLSALNLHLGDLVEVDPTSGGMHIVCTPKADRADNFRDLAVAATAAVAGLAVQPLSTCYAGPQSRHGLILGFASTPEEQVDQAVHVLRQVIIQSLAGSSS